MAVFFHARRTEGYMAEVATLEAPAAETQDANTTPDTQATAAPVKEAVATSSAHAGTDGEQPSEGEATLQTADKPEAELADSKPAPVVPTLTAEEAIAVAERRLQERADRAKAEEAAQKTQAELRDLRRNGPRLARQVLDRIAEDAEIVISSDVRSQLEDWAENIGLKSLDAAKLELGDVAQTARQQEQQDFVDAAYAFIDPRNRDAFSKEVDGKGHDAWFKAAAKYAPRAPGVVMVDELVTDAQSYATDDANNLTAAEQKLITDALKGAKTGKAVIEAVGKVMRSRGQRDPGDGVGGNGRANTGAPSSRLEAEQMHAGMHPSGQTITTAQMRKYLETGQI